MRASRGAGHTIKGFEVMRALRKGQGRGFNLTRDPIGEKRMIERAFGLGPGVMAETMAWREDQRAARFRQETGEFYSKGEFETEPPMLPPTVTEAFN